MPDAKATFALVGQDQTAAAFSSALASTQAFAAKASELLKGAFAIGGISIAADFIKSIADLGEDLEKGASRAGLAQSQFNQLAAAFGEADISAESLSKGIKNMQIALSKADSGDKPLAAAFNQIGLSATSLKQLSPDVQLLAIAEALSKISDPADRARIGVEILGKQFLELEPQLQKGAEGLGAIINAAHGMSDEDTARLAKFAEQLNRLWQATKLFAAGTVADVAAIGPGLKDVFSSDLETRIEAIQRALSNPGNFDASALDRMKTQLAALQAQAKQLQTASPAANISSALSEQGKGQMEAATQAILKNLIDVHTAEENLDMKAAADREKQLDQEWKDTQTAGGKRLDFESKIDDLLLAHRITQIDAIRALYDKEITASNALESKSASEQNAGAIAAAWQGTQKQFSESTDAMAAKSKLMTDSMVADWNKTKENAAQAASAIEDSFATFLVDPFQGGLKTMLTAWIQTIDQMVAKAAAQSIFKSLFGDSGLGGFFQSFLGGGGTSVSYDASPGAASAILDAGPFATGGSFNVGGSGGTDSQLVRFRASPDENVTVSRPGQGSGGVTVVNHNYIDSRTDSSQIGQLIQQSTQYAINQSVARISDMSRRGRFGNNG